MIGFLHGDVASVSETRLVLDVRGVGYRVNVPTSVPAVLNAGDRDVRIHTSMIVSEGSMELYGFLSPEERDVFETLITVSGIGPKGAVKMLSLPRERLIDAIRDGDIGVLTTIPGVGKKTAERMCLELRDKLSKDFGARAAGLPPGIAADGEAAIAVQGLQALGFAASEIRSFLKALPEKELDKMTAQEIVTLCLKKKR
jgi:holliday junction DNA helicase RuvA